MQKSIEEWRARILALAPPRGGSHSRRIPPFHLARDQVAPSLLYFLSFTLWRSRRMWKMALSKPYLQPEGWGMTRKEALGAGTPGANEALWASFFNSCMNARSLRVITQQVTGVGVFLSVARSHNSTFPVERGTLCSPGHPAEPLHGRGNWGASLPSALVTFRHKAGCTCHCGCHYIDKSTEYLL